MNETREKLAFIPLVSLLLAIGAFVAPAWAEQERADLQIPDVLTRPGDPVDVAVKLEKAGPHGIDISGAQIEFRLDGKTIGVRKTDEHGDASIRVDAPAAGDHVLKAIFNGDTRYTRVEYRALLAVRRPTDPVIVLDIDWTLSMTDELNTSLGGRDCPPIKDAPEAAERLGQRYTLVYVTSRARQLRKRTISWLARYGFPHGPCYFLDPVEFPSYDTVAYKKSVLAPLKQKFPRFKIGIGNDQDDLDSYKAVGLQSLLIAAKPIPGAVVAPDWPAAEKAFAKLEAGGSPGK